MRYYCMMRRSRLTINAICESEQLRMSSVIVNKHKTDFIDFTYEFERNNSLVFMDQVLGRFPVRYYY
jgi:hypothetical protein